RDLLSRKETGPPADHMYAREAPLPFSDSFLAYLFAQAASPLFWLIGGVTIFAIAVSKGAFGGGLASIGIPMLSLLIDPIGAAIIVAPLVSLMDMFTLRTFGPSSWSKPDLKVLLPGLLIGLGIGWLVFETVDSRLVALLIGLISLSFALHWFWKRSRKTPSAGKPVSTPLGVIAGIASGFTTFVAHAGGPPVVMYLIGRHLEKRLFVGTITAFFTIGNLIKLGPYSMLMAARPDAAAAALLLAPLVPLGVWLGLRAHKHLSFDAIMLIMNIVLILGGSRLIWQALAGFAR
ncbi:MAG: sulfite exporter TauE/SafE family protein, partial [Rhabdaerophilum sp.]